MNSFQLKDEEFAAIADGIDVAVLMLDPENQPPQYTPADVFLRVQKAFKIIERMAEEKGLSLVA